VVLIRCDKDFRESGDSHLEMLKMAALPGRFSTNLKILPSSFDKSFRFFPMHAPCLSYVNDELHGHAKQLKTNLFSIIAGCLE